MVNRRIGCSQRAVYRDMERVKRQRTEECRRLLDGLGREELRMIALLKMEGYTVEEIAGRHGCAPITVKRKLRHFRCLWAPEGAV
jgi:DNA-directed RNA polymerase specialized sigma24 family protein